MLLAAYLVLFLLTLALIVSVARLADLLPQYSDQLTSGGNECREHAARASASSRSRSTPW